MDVIKTNQTDELKCILKYKPDIIHLVKGKNTLLHEVSRLGYAKALEVLLLESGIHHINDMDGYGYTALMHASLNGQKECVKLLLEQNSDVNIKVSIKHNRGFTALMHASRYNHNECVKMLLEHNADVNVKNSEGFTALIWASTNGHTGCVKLLLEHNANVNAKNSVGNTALINASSRGHKDCEILLLRYNADDNIRNNRGRTAYDVRGKKWKFDT